MIRSASFIDLRQTITTGGGTGIDGVDGLSAYEIALNYGFVGSEEEWLQSLGSVTIAKETIIVWSGSVPTIVRKYADASLTELLSTITLTWVDGTCVNVDKDGVPIALTYSAGVPTRISRS